MLKINRPEWFKRFSNLQWSLLKGPPMPQIYPYLLILFAGYAIADLAILQVREMMLPKQAPPLKSPARAQRHAPVSASNYSTITQRNPFNADGEIPPPLSAAEEGKPKKDGPAVPSRLPLGLIGTIVHFDPSKSVATLMLRNKNEVKAYKNGEEVEGMAQLNKIERRKVIFRNLNNGQLEYIEIKEENRINFGFRRKAAPPAAGDSSGEVKKVADNKFKLDRSTIRKYTEDLPSLLSQARAVPNIAPGSSGQVNGFRFLEIAPDSILSELGLKKFDVIKSVNGEPVDSANKAMELYQMLRDSDQITLGIERNGQNEEFNYSITE